MIDSPIFIIAFNSIVLSLAAAIMAAMAAYIFKFESAATRCSIWATAFFAAVVLTFLTFQPNINVVASPSYQQLNIANQSLADGVIEKAVSGAADASINSTLSSIIPFTLLFLWAAGAIWQGFMLIRDAVNIAALRNEAERLREPVSEDTDAQNVEVRTHPGISAPFACGLFRPVIIVPKNMIEKTDRRILTNILGHEKAHIIRKDLVSAFLESVVLCLLWWNPVLRYIRNRISIHREMACDDLAIVNSCSTTDYTQALLSVAEAQLFSSPITTKSAALCVAHSRSPVHNRICRLLSDRYQTSEKESWVVGIIAQILISSLLAGAAIAAPQASVQLTIAYQTFESEQPAPQNETEALGRELVRVIAAQDFKTADSLIRKGADIDAIVYRDGTPLIASVNVGSAEMVEKLLQAGANTEIIAPYDETALISAVRRGDEKIVALLLSSGSDPNRSAVTETGERRSPLGEAVKTQNSTIVRILRNAGARK